MVSSAAADRVESMIADAVAKGARLVLKPERRGAILGPAIVARAPPDARLMQEEAFGPVDAKALQGSPEDRNSC